MASNIQGRDETGGISEDGATKRSYSNRDSTLQPDEDIAQIRKRVLEANNALRASGLAWSSEPEGEEAGDDDEEEEDEEVESSEDGDEEDEEDEGKTHDKALPSAPTADTITHVWVLSWEKGDGYKDNDSGISGVFRNVDNAVQTVIPEVRDYGFGENEDDEMYFKDEEDFVGIAQKDSDSYTWRFQDAEGGFMTFELRRLPIL